MKGTRYTAEFKVEAVKQITERGHGVVEVAHRLGVSDKSLYVWIKQARQRHGLSGPLPCATGRSCSTTWSSAKPLPSSGGIKMHIDRVQ